jgi:glycosyltransferase involved in cell wall biosynthesis
MPALQPKVSICIPAYNQPLLLKRCLASILIQTFEDFEVIITDDSRHNEIEDIVQEFNDPRIFYHKNVRPLDSPANWNKAVEYVKGEYIKILHHDDWFSTDTALERFVMCFEKDPNLSFVFSQCYNITRNESFVHKASHTFYTKLAKSPEICLFVNGIGAPSVTMFSKEVAQIPFDINSKWYVDVIFYVSVFKKFKKIGYIKEPLLNITTGLETQVTNTTPGKRKIIEAIYTFNYFGYFNKRPLPLLLILLFAELFRKYQIKRLTEVKDVKFEKDITDRLTVSFFLSKIPVTFKLYALIRRIIINYMPV